MKKIYAMLALALGLGLSATAAPKLAVQKATIDASGIVKYVEPIADGIADGSTTLAKAPAMAPAKAVTSTSDLIGLKNWEGVRMFGVKEDQGQIINGPQSDVCFVESNRDTRITLVDFPTTGLSLNLNVDMAKKEVSFDSGTYAGSLEFQDGSIGEYYLYVRQIPGIIFDNASGLWKYTGETTQVDKAIGKILDDGSISFEGYTILASTPDMIAEGSVWTILNTANIIISPAKFNTPVESEYTFRGKGEYTDPYFSPLLVAQDLTNIPVNKNAEVYTKWANGSIMVAVKNPYKDVPGVVPTQSGEVEVPSFWEAVGCLDGEDAGNGWLLFQVFQSDKFKAYPNVAACLQMVHSGVVMDDSEEQDGSELTDYYLFNLEGMALNDNGEDGLINQLEKFEDTDTPYSAVENNVLSIYNCYFGFGTQPTTPYWWRDVVRTVGTVTLPDGWDNFSGIESVAGENVNAPVKYYNLHGIELAAPVKGQLTIKKQGNKTVKFIAK